MGLNNALMVKEVSYLLSCQLVGIIISKQDLCYKDNK